MVFSTDFLRGKYVAILALFSATHAQDYLVGWDRIPLMARQDTYPNCCCGTGESIRKAAGGPPGAWAAAIFAFDARGLRRSKTGFQ